MNKLERIASRLAVEKPLYLFVCYEDDPDGVGNFYQVVAENLAQAKKFVKQSKELSKSEWDIRFQTKKYDLPKEFLKLKPGVYEQYSMGGKKTKPRPVK